MSIQYDKDADALSVRIKDKPYFESEEIEDGVILDYDNDKSVIGIEILNLSQIMNVDSRIPIHLIEEDQLPTLFIDEDKRNLDASIKFIDLAKR